MDHCNSCAVSNRFLWFLQRWVTWNWRIQSSPLSVPWDPEPSGSCIQSFSSANERNPIAQIRLFTFLTKSSTYSSLNQTIGWRLGRDLLCYLCTRPSPWVRVISPRVSTYLIVHLSNCDIKTDGRRALLLQAIQEWLPMLTFLAPLLGTKLKIFPG